MNVPNLFGGLKIDNIYKYLLYLGGVILILSIFFDTKQVDILAVRKASFSLVVLSLAIWLIHNFILDLMDYHTFKLDNELEFKFSEAKTIIINTLVAKYILMSLGLVIGYLWITSFF